MARSTATALPPDSEGAVDPHSVKNVRIEGCTVCQLRCPSCPTPAGEVARQLGNGYLRHSDFLSFVQNNPWVERVELSNWGEIFLNPELLEIMKSARSSGVRLTASNGANLNNVRPEVLEGLVRYRFHRIRCSIDGGSESTYSVYRVRGNFNRVIDNIRTINRHKSAMDSPFPRLTWQFIIFGHNESEIPAAKELAKELDMEISFKLSWDEAFSPPRDFDFIERHTGFAAPTRSLFRKKSGKNYLGAQKFCRQLWVNPQINYDGRILGCCVNRWGDFGVAEDWSLQDSLNNEKIRYAREMLTGRRESRDDVPCTTCNYYKKMKESGEWLDPPEAEIRES